MATPPKELHEPEILAFYDRIVKVLRAEGYIRFHSHDGEQIPLEPGAPGSIVGVLLTILRRAQAARARVLRARRKAKHEAMGTTDYQVYNDAPRDDAHRALRGAESHLHLGLRDLQVAQQALNEHGANIEKETYPAPLEEPRVRGIARGTGEALCLVEKLLDELRSLESSRDTSTVREWDDLVTDFAIELYEAGVNDWRIAEILLNRHDEGGAEAINQRRRRRRVADPTPGAPAP